MLPLVSVLLCVSQKEFFFEHWTAYLNLCMANIKQKDPALQNLCMSGISRLVWVYCVRIHGESNLVTEKKLKFICDALFPLKTSAVYPKDEPTFAFSKTILYMTQVRSPSVLFLQLMLILGPLRFRYEKYYL